MAPRDPRSPVRLPLLSVVFVALAVAVLVSLAGCRRGPVEHGPSAGTPRRGGTVVIGWTQDLKGVNEYTAPAAASIDEVLFRIFRHLLTEQPDFASGPPSFKPELALSYEWSADHKALTFHLRPEAVWSDGVGVTADDVRFSWQAQVSPDVAWDSSYMKENITDVQVVDPHTVRFVFSRVYAKQLLDANEGVILPKHVWEKLPFKDWRSRGDWFRAHLVVCGPFTLESWKPQQEIVLARNPRYYDPTRPYLDKVVFRVVPDQASLTTQLFSGEVDFISQVAVEAADRVAKDPRLELLSYWPRSVVGLAWNLERAPFDDPEVRRALTLAIDRKVIAETVFGAYGRAANSPIITEVWAHHRELPPWPYDPAEARRILAARGFKDTDGDGILDRGGKPLAFEVMSNAGNRQRNDAAVMIQAQLRKIGVRAEPRVLEFNTFLAESSAGRFDAAIEGLGMDTSLDLTGYFDSHQVPPAGSNFGRYNNPEVDMLIARSISRADLADSRADLLRIQEILNRDLPYTFLWESQRLTAINRRLHDVKPNALFSLFNLQDWWVDAPGR